MDQPMDRKTDRLSHREGDYRRKEKEREKERERERERERQRERERERERERDVNLTLVLHAKLGFREDDSGFNGIVTA